MDADQLLMCDLHWKDVGRAALNRGDERRGVRTSSNFILTERSAFVQHRLPSH